MKTKSLLAVIFFINATLTQQCRAVIAKCSFMTNETTDKKVLLLGYKYIEIPQDTNKQLLIEFQNKNNDALAKLLKECSQKAINSNEKVFCYYAYPGKDRALSKNSVIETLEKLLEQKLNKIVFIPLEENGMWVDFFYIVKTTIKGKTLKNPFNEQKMKESVVKSMKQEMFKSYNKTTEDSFKAIDSCLDEVNKLCSSTQNTNLRAALIKNNNKMIVIKNNITKQLKKYDDYIDFLTNADLTTIKNVCEFFRNFIVIYENSKYLNILLKTIDSSNPNHLIIFVSERLNHDELKSGLSQQGFKVTTEKNLFLVTRNDFEEFEKYLNNVDKKIDIKPLKIKLENDLKQKRICVLCGKEATAENPVEKRPIYKEDAFCCWQCWLERLCLD